jgi:UDP-glucose:glycoprotein glucosyltransferase
MSRFVVALALGVATTVYASSVEVQVKANWQQTPILAEASEAVGSFGVDAFWAFVDMTAPIAADIKKQFEVEGESGTTTASPQLDQYSRVLSLIPALIFNEAQQKLARSELAARAFSPRVRAHHSLALNALRAATSENEASCKSDAFFDFGGGVIACDAESLQTQLDVAGRLCSRPESVDLEDEHVMRPSASAAYAMAATARFAGSCRPHAVLYGVLGTDQTLAFVKLARKEVDAGRMTLIFRHYIADERNLDYALGVQGYGITIDVKNMEYKAVDEKKNDGSETAGDADAERTLPPVVGIDISLLRRRYPTLMNNISEFAHAASSKVNDDLDLKVWEVQKLGLQAGHKILSSSNPMATLSDITENFPARVGQISRVATDAEFDANVQAMTVLGNQFGDGENRLWINDRLVDAKDYDLFSVLRSLREEETQHNRVLAALTATPRTNPQLDFSAEVNKVLRCPVKSVDEAEKPRLWVDESLPLWINNVAEDDMYQHLDTNLNGVLKPGMYGQPNFVRRNILNMVYVVNPALRDDIEALASFARPYQQQAPVRFGVLLAFDSADVDAAAAFVDGTEEAAFDATGRKIIPVPVLIAAVLETLAANVEDTSSPAMFLVRMLYSLGMSPVLTEDTVRLAARGFGITAIEPTSATVAFMRNASAAIKSLGLAVTPAALFNGKVATENVDGLLFQQFNIEFGKIRELVRTKALTDDVEDVYGAIHAKLGAIKRYQPAIFDDVIFTEWRAEHEPFLESLSWLYAIDYQYEVADVTHILRVNVSTAAGLRDLTRALRYLLDCPKGVCAKSRLAVAPSHNSRADAVVLSVMHAAKSLPEKKRIAFVHQFVSMMAERASSDAALTDESHVNTVANSILRELGAPYASVLQWSPDYELDRCNSIVRDQLPPRTTYVGSFIFTNGRVTRVDESFLSADYIVLDRQERDLRSASLAKCLEPLDFTALTSGKVSGDDLTAEYHSNKLFVVASAVAAGLVKQGPKAPPSAIPFANALNAFKTGEDAARARHSIVAVVNPVSRPAQRLVALINFVTSALNVSARIHMNPSRSLQKVPIKNYYRFVASAELQFNEAAIAAPKLNVRGLPTNVVLTLGLDDPDSWMVFAAEAEDDLDNIKLPSGGQTRRVVYELKNLVLTGSCIDTSRMSPPRGLPLEIVDSSGTRDTLVMSNYGYFQLQARPGIAELRIQEGRGSEIYELESLNGSPSFQVAVASFSGAALDLRVHRKDGMQAADLLADNEDSKGAGGGIFGGLFGSRKVAPWPPAEAGDKQARPEKPTLNILSLASGHLYERFLRLMIHTVMKSSSDIHGKNTTRIKFWLIETPMSPRFKRLLPHLAEKYGFEYGLVNYKWPHWLTRQTEKQRQIWAYKVLFLDVLFPLDVEKIIFVDADQIVRSDLHELYNLDLQGKPVAYTPFCQDAARDETKGFRFWDSGYWKDHLAGKPYHISAIYVVDLVRLRQLAAGDRYRMIYDNLAQDPNSLANLDQDLPNFAQHQVPIYSLPEEWLWCETWCSDASKPAAKTIDLCNNPQTKTPKLENAKRIIPDWEDMDKELQDFEDAVLGQH